MQQNFLHQNEIIASANKVKYHNIEYNDNYVVVTQNRTRRRVYSGYYFEDTGTHIYISIFCSGMFQHKNKVRNFILNTSTKEWRDAQLTIIEHHRPEKIDQKEVKPIKELQK